MAAPLALLAAGLLGLAAAPGAPDAPDALWEGVPWGFYTNYLDPQHPSVTNDMLTDAMATEAGRAGVESQLAGMAARNATLWRIFPQFQDVLASPSKVNTTGIAVLTRALDMAAAHGIRVTVTGLSDFVPAHNPAWLRELGEAEDSDALISAASSVWWGALAKAWKGHPAVFSFGTLPAHTPPHNTHHPTPRSSRRSSPGRPSADLMNEPIWATGPNRPAGDPRVTGCMGAIGDQKCFDFVHNRHWQTTWTAWVRENFADEAAIRAAWPDFPVSNSGR